MYKKTVSYSYFFQSDCHEQLTSYVNLIDPITKIKRTSFVYFAIYLQLVNIILHYLSYHKEDTVVTVGYLTPISEAIILNPTGTGFPDSRLPRSS